MKRKFSVIFTFIVLISAFQSCSSVEDSYLELELTDELSLSLQEQLKSIYGSQSYLILPNSQDFVNIPSDSKNPLTPSKVHLGQLLFHETAIGNVPLRAEGMQTYSCASCHHSRAGFQSGTKQGIGEGGSGFGIFGESRQPLASYPTIELDVQPIRSPTILNTAYQEVMLWNGQFGATGLNEGTIASWEPGTPKEKNRLGFQGLETQAIAGMNVHRMSIEPEFINDNPLYKELFDQAFSDVIISERYSSLNAGLAIAAYERTVLSSEAPFQRWLRGDFDAMTEAQLRGAELFFGKAECYVCHSGPALNSMTFHALGMADFEEGTISGKVDETIKRGRGGFTLLKDDMFAFKTPTIYNLKDLKFLGHGGSFSSVEEVIRYKNGGVAENDEVPSQNLSPFFYPLKLSEEEIELLSSFVEDALFDPNLDRFVPEALPSGFCFPVADPQSKQDLNCDKAPS